MFTKLSLIEASTVSTYESDLKQVTEEITKIMENLNSVHDGVQIHVNHFGQWVAKYRTRGRTIHYAFGSSLLNALKNLKDNPNKEI